MQIERLKTDFVADIANLHYRGIPTGFLSSLGPKFLTALYYAIARSESAFGFVVRENERTLGFIAFTDNLNRLYQVVIKQNFFRFSLLLVCKMLDWSRIKKVLQTLLYPGKTRKLDLPTAELLAIVIDESARGRGLATQLLQVGLDECQNRNIDKVKVLVAADNQPANQLYHKFGFQLVGNILSHNIPSNLYVKSLTQQQLR
jgi:ribosomal protein S18 acetylase RimI-like enzyme